MDRRFEMRERLLVWTALSELFLDTSFDEADFDRIAAVLRQSPYQRAEIEQILRNEVSPAFARNLLSIAGEWARWSEDEVQAIMERWLEEQSARGWIARIKRRFTPKVVPNDWHIIAARLE